MIDDLVGLVRGGCDRIEVTGQYRRGVPDPDLLWFLVVPRLVPRPFADDEQPDDAFVDRLRDLVDARILDVDEMRGAFGSRRATPDSHNFIYRGARVRFTATTEEAWGAHLMLSTGPWKFVVEVMERSATRGGHATLDGDGRVVVAGSPIPVTDETLVFRMLGETYIPPRQRYPDLRA